MCFPASGNRQILLAKGAVNIGHVYKSDSTQAAQWNRLVICMPVRSVTSGRCCVPRGSTAPLHSCLLSPNAHSRCFPEAWYPPRSHMAVAKRLFIDF